MDILSFALYHENHQMKSLEEEKRVSTPELREDRKRGRSDSDDMDMDDEMEDANKAKQRPSTSTITSSSQEGESLRTRIWNELKSNNDAMSLADICKDVTDRSSVENAIQDCVYSIDYL